LKNKNLTYSFVFYLVLLLFFPVLKLSAQVLPFENPNAGTGIPTEVESMYTKGLDFLAKTQTQAGTWADNYGNQPGVIGLCVIAMLAHGDDPNTGKYASNIKKGINAILESANGENGYLGKSMYNHGFATLALAESFGMVHDSRIGPALKKAVKLILSSQVNNPRKAWRYGPESNDADTTVSGALLVALFAAANAGIEVPSSSIENALKFYESCQSVDGGFGYTAPGGSNLPRTAIGVLVYSLANKKGVDVYKKAFQYLKTNAFEEMPTQGYYYYYLYYASQAFFHSENSSEWKRWNNLNIKTLENMQGGNGSWSGNHGTVFSTAAALLSLALNYRFLPIYERQK